MSEDVLDDDREREDWDSGPFCPHWYDPSLCDEPCRCGHTCRHHAIGSGCMECDCEEFQDAEEKGTP